MSEAISGISPVWSRVTNIIADRGEGSIIFGKDGKEYLDFTCGIGVTNTGHCHPRVVEGFSKDELRSKLESCYMDKLTLFFINR